MATVLVKRSTSTLILFAAGLKCRSQVTGQVTGYRPQATGHVTGYRSGYRSQATGHRPQVRSQVTQKTIGHWTKLD